jgi:hypothetical protein
MSGVLEVDNKCMGMDREVMAAKMAIIGTWFTLLMVTSVLAIQALDTAMYMLVILLFCTFTYPFLR